MTRLTDKNTHMPNTAAGLEDFELKLAIYDKLSEVEDIEDALSCPIDVLFKALKQGVYEIDDRGYIYHSDVSYIGRKYLVKVYYAWGDDEDAQFKYFKFEDYGKKTPGGWALTKEELEKGGQTKC